MMSAAIDACERLDHSGYGESDLAATAEVNGTGVSIGDVLESAVTYPVLVIKSEPDEASDPASGNAERRIVIAMTKAAASLVGDGRPSAEVRQDIVRMLEWFDGHAVETVHRALAGQRGSSS